MFGKLFEIVINLLATLVQIVVAPVNAIIVKAMPLITPKIEQVISVLNGAFDSISWAIGLVPKPVIVACGFCILCEIAKHTIFTSTHALLKIWNLFQKLKFW